MDKTDEELVAEYLGGDESAFAQLLDRYLKQIYNFALRLGGMPIEAEDIAQETFVKAWRNLRRYQSKSASFRTWLYSIARNTTIDFLRKKKHVPFSDFDDKEGGNSLAESIQDESPPAETLFAQGEDAVMIEKMLEMLPVRAREVIVLRYREEMTFEEIGIVLSEPLNTVKSRHRRALIALRKILDQRTDI